MNILDPKEFASEALISPENPARVYSFNSGDLQLLFSRIIESLSSPDESEAVIGRILVEICKHFRFGCGFVYEADHTQTFHLKKHYSAYGSEGLPHSFRLDVWLDSAAIRDMLANSVFYRHLEEGADEHSLSRLFETGTLMMAPVVNKDNLPIGLVGMMDRRRNILLDGQAIDAARMVLNLLANNVKLGLYQRSLEYVRQSLVNILDNTGIDIYVSDFDTHEILYVNKTMAAPYGGRQNMIGRKCWETLHAGKTGQCQDCPQKKLIDENGEATKNYSWDYRRHFDGSWFRVQSSAFRWVDGRLAHVVSSVDITESKNNEATIAQMANYDPLTNLPNRRKLMMDCQEAMEKGGGYLLFFDLDDFKKLNDSMGHQAGDELLAEVGSALLENPLTMNRAYRYGGDEFLVLLADADRDEAAAVVDFLITRFNQPWNLKEASPICRASIGVAAFPAAGISNPDELLHRADMMMYKAKRQGRGIACFDDGECVPPG